MGLITTLTERLLHRRIGRVVAKSMKRQSVGTLRAPEVRAEHRDALEAATAKLERVFAPTGMRDWFSGYSSMHAGRIAQDLACVGGAIKDGDARALEIGGMPFLFTEAFCALHPSVQLTTVDIDPSRVALPADSKFGTVKHDIEAGRFPAELSEAFDLVILHEIFEHLRLNPFRVLTEAHGCLKAGGRLSVTTPNLHSAVSLSALVRAGQAGPSHKEYEKLEDLGHMGHAREYSLLEMITMLKAAGFSRVTLLQRGSDEEIGRYGGLGGCLLPLTHLIATR